MKPILTSLTFAKISARDPCLIALTVFFKAVGFFTITSFGMKPFFWIDYLIFWLPNKVNFWFEGIWISLDRLHYSFSSWLSPRSIFTIDAITIVWASVPTCKAIAIKLEALWLFAVTPYSSGSLGFIIRKNLLYFLFNYIPFPSRWDFHIIRLSGLFFGDFWSFELHLLLLLYFNWLNFFLQRYLYFCIL